MVLEGVSKFVLVSAILSAVSFLVHMIGFGAPHWLEHDNSYAGIWKGCNKLNEECINLVGQTTSAIEATQAFETLAFLVLLATVVVFGLRITLMKDNTILPKLTMGLQFGAVGMILLGVIIYAAKSPLKTFGYAFALVIVAAIISLVAVIVNFLDFRSNSGTTPK